MNRVVRGWRSGVVVSCALLILEDAARSQVRPPSAGATRLEIVSGSKAEYRVREQLARLNFPNDAVGTTESVTGVIVIRPDGSFVSDASKLTVDLRTLRSDEQKRDAFLRDNTLETRRYPFAEFVPRRQKGLTTIPTSGTASFQLTGDMTLHGVTSELTWDVEGSFAGDTVTAKATTRFDFAKFKITTPRVFGLLSVDDDIRLELNVRMRRGTINTASS